MFSHAAGFGGLLKEGARHYSGLEEAILKNIDAAKQLSKIPRTSLGPNGMNKMVITHLDKLLVTSDAATIVKELEVMHPAAKMLVMAAKQQEQEIGDATNLVLVFGGELLSQAELLIRMGLHPSDIVSGFEKASKRVLELLDDLVAFTVTDRELRDKAVLTKCIRTVVAAKQYGLEDLIADKIATACLNVMPRNPKNFNVDNVRVAKVLGASIHDTQVVHGLVVVRDSESSVKSVVNSKVAVFGCPFDASATETKGTVLLHNAEELMNYSKGEEQHLDELVKSIADTGARVIVSGGSVSDMALHFIEKYGLMCVKIQSKFELRRLCRAVNATALVKVAAPTPDELGFADEVRVMELGSTKCTVFRRDAEESKVATIVVRGSTTNLMDDVERVVDDAVNIVKALVRDGRFVAGAGASEIELAHRLQQFAAATPGLDQYAVYRYAEALEVVPRTLAENAGLNANEIISSLYSAHQRGSKNVGLDVENGGLKDVVADDNVLDHLLAKHWALKLASDAAITVLRVDQIIMSKPAGGPKPGERPHGEDED